MRQDTEQHWQQRVHQGAGVSDRDPRPAQGLSSKKQWDRLARGAWLLAGYSNRVSLLQGLAISNLLLNGLFPPSKSC